MRIKSQFRARGFEGGKTKTHLRGDNEAKTKQTADRSLDEQDTVNVGRRDEEGEMLEDDGPGETKQEAKVRAAVEKRKDDHEAKELTKSPRC